MHWNKCQATPNSQLLPTIVIVDCLPQGKGEGWFGGLISWCETLPCLLPLKFWVSRSENYSGYWSSGLDCTWSCLQSFALSVPSAWKAGPLDLYRSCCLLINSFSYLICRYQLKGYLLSGFPCLLRLKYCTYPHTSYTVSLLYFIYFIWSTIWNPIHHLFVCLSPLDYKSCEGWDFVFSILCSCCLQCSHKIFVEWTD